MQYKTWGAEQIEPQAIAQMTEAMELPVAVAGALMPDAHLGYGLPIGGVLALDNAVCPYAVGVDIACRMKLTVFNTDPVYLDLQRDHFVRILEENTYFGMGVENPTRPEHHVLDEDWNFCDTTREHYARACLQLGTSGSGNHFVEWGVVKDGGEEYVGLLSHSGSRGPGAKVCNFYSKLAKTLRPEHGELAWLDLDRGVGQQYWAAMELMGRYASANHDCIHRAIAGELGDSIIETMGVENHHNFAWKETHGDREVIVHRKGATPAGKGVMGIIPGSMGTPAFIVSGKGNLESLCSSSHGAGRAMSRNQAKKLFDYPTQMAHLAKQGVTVLSAGVDEVVGCYKDIHKVMAAQTDLVDVVAEFHPKIVKMAPETTRRW